MELVQLARHLGVDDSEIIKTLKFAGIDCESELDGLHIGLFTPIRTLGTNLVKLHLNKFGTFPIVALPGVNLFCWIFPDLCNETGIDVLVGQTLKDIPDIENTGLSHEELFNLVQFLTCIWTDIRVELYNYSFLIHWRPLVSFINPVYYRSGQIEAWDKECNILKAELLEIINSTYKFLSYSYGDYHKKLGSEIFNRKRSRRVNSLTYFTILNARSEDMYEYPGIKCLNTARSREWACKLLTILRQLLARLCCMLLRNPITSIPIQPTTWKTLPDDVKQIFKIIQKMENYLNV